MSLPHRPWLAGILTVAACAASPGAAVDVPADAEDAAAPAADAATATPDPTDLEDGVAAADAAPSTTADVPPAPCPTGCASHDGLCVIGTCVDGKCKGVAAPSGTPCDDGLGCTEADVCLGAGQCKGTSILYSHAWFEPGFADEARAVTLTVDAPGGAVLAGTRVGSGGSDLLVQRLTPAGNLAWQQAIHVGAADEGYAVAPLAGGFLVAGDALVGDQVELLAARVSAKGLILWQKTYGGAKNEHGRAAVATADGAVLVAGSTRSGVTAGGSDAWLVRLDAAGSQLTAKTYGFAGDDIAHAMALAPDGGVFLAGSATETDSTGKVAFWRVDAAGGLLWQSQLPVLTAELNGTARAVAFLPGGDVMACGYRGEVNHEGWIGRFDGVGKPVWSAPLDVRCAGLAVSGVTSGLAVGFNGGDRVLGRFDGNGLAEFYDWLSDGGDGRFYAATFDGHRFLAVGFVPGPGMTQAAAAARRTGWGNADCSKCDAKPVEQCGDGEPCTFYDCTASTLYVCEASTVSSCQR